MKKLIVILSLILIVSELLFLTDHWTNVSLLTKVHLFSFKPENPVFHNGRDAIQSGLVTGSILDSATACRTCHSRIFNNWKEDRHGQAWTNKAFQLAYKRESKDWCIHCHAPLLKQKEEIHSGYSQSVLKISDEGINCASCHIREGRAISLTQLKKPEFCAECHQFNFPVIHGEEIQYTSVWMQNTFEEWKDAKSDKRCQDCHFKNHILKGPRDSDWLKKRFRDFRVEPNEGIIHISFIFDGPAHRAPTGDLFRSFVLEVSGDQDFKSKVFYTKRWARFYKSGFLEPGLLSERTLQKNSSFLPGENKISLTIDQKYPEIYVRLIYYFHDPNLGGDPELPIDSIRTILMETLVKPYSK
jgi:hypothetical protein